MRNVTFLEAKLGALAKTIEPAGVTPYPNARQFHSHTVLCPTLNDFHAAVTAAAHRGHSLHVGDLVTPLTQWGSRAGLAKRDSGLRWFVLDVDKLGGFHVQTPITSAQLTALADAVVAHLGIEALADTSYVAHASATLGLRPDTVSLHLFFMLSDAVSSTDLKGWMKSLNLTTPTLQASIRLSATGHALTWPLDVTCADTGRLVYIAPPRFHGVPDPFATPGDRFAIVQKMNNEVDAAGVRATAGIDRLENQTKARLRDAAGLAPRERARMKTVVLGNQQIELLMNPAQGSLRFSHTARGFSYYNLNDGDSAAYYHPEYRPDIIFNFKGEPAFRWADLDRLGYDAYCETNAEQIARVDPVNTFMVLNKLDDRAYKIWHNHEQEQVTIVGSSREAIPDFHAEYGKLEPDFLPTWTIEYNPPLNYQVDYTGKAINRFVPSAIMKRGATEHLDDLNIENGALLAERCPAIWFLLDHVTGNDQKAVLRLLNWLAVIIQHRIKTQTAWVFQGTEGTGKGTLYSEVLVPLFGADNASMRSNDDLEDNFNAWRSNKLIVCVDEFEVPNTQGGQRLMAKLRNWIMEPKASVRAMRRMAEDTPVYENYLFFTNRHNIMPIPDTDRRYSICSRQEIPIKKLVDTVELYTNIRAEIDTFGALLHAWDANIELARVCMDSRAKLLARTAAKTSVEEFAHALATGDLDFMLQIFDVLPSIQDPALLLTRDAAARAVRTMVATRKNTEPTAYPVGDIANIYNTMFEQRMTTMGFGKMLARLGVDASRRYVGHTQMRCFLLSMNKSELSDAVLDALQSERPGSLRLVEG